MQPRFFSAVLLMNAETSSSIIYIKVFIFTLVSLSADVVSITTGSTPKTIIALPLAVLNMTFVRNSSLLVILRFLSNFFSFDML